MQLEIKFIAMAIIIIMATVFYILAAGSFFFSAGTKYNHIVTGLLFLTGVALTVFAYFILKL